MTIKKVDAFLVSCDGTGCTALKVRVHDLDELKNILRWEIIDDKAYCATCCMEKAQEERRRKLK